MLQPKQKLGTVSCVMYGSTSMQLIPQRCGYREQEQEQETRARPHSSTCHVNAGPSAVTGDHVKVIF